MSDTQSQIIFRNLFGRGLKLGETNTASKHFVSFFLQVHRDINYPKLLDILNDIPTQQIKHLPYMIFFIRSPRGGRGERMLGRFCYQWLLIMYPEIMIQNLANVPEYGRWDDIFFLFPGKKTVLKACIIFFLSINKIQVANLIYFILQLKYKIITVNKDYETECYIFVAILN